MIAVIAENSALGAYGPGCGGFMQIAVRRAYIKSPLRLDVEPKRAIRLQAATPCSLGKGGDQALR